MDLVDDWNKTYQITEYEDMLKFVLDFQKEFPQGIWVWGNHDLSYVWGFKESGFSQLALPVCSKYYAEIREQTDIRYIRKIDDCIFCHGGLTEYYVKSYIQGVDFDDIDEVINKINQEGPDKIWCDDSPVWYRPQYRGAPMYKQDKLLQVVGHTPVTEITFDKERNFISTDVFSTDRWEFPIGTEDFLILDTETHEFITVK